jgi:hypothetical protein
MSPTRYTPVRLTRAGRVTMPPQICSPVHLIHQLDEGRVLMSSTRCSPVHLNRAGWVMMSPTRWRSVLVHFNPQIDRFRMAAHDVSNQVQSRSFKSPTWFRPPHDVSNQVQSRLFDTRRQCHDVSTHLQSRSFDSPTR